MGNELKDFQYLVENCINRLSKKDVIALLKEASLQIDIAMENVALDLKENGEKVEEVIDKCNTIGNYDSPRECYDECVSDCASDGYGYDEKLVSHRASNCACKASYQEVESSPMEEVIEKRGGIEQCVEI